jgi:hypothetical protein
MEIDDNRVRTRGYKRRASEDDNTQRLSKRFRDLSFSKSLIYSKEYRL